MKAKQLITKMTFVVVFIIITFLITGCDEIIVSETPEPTITTGATVEPTAASGSTEAEPAAGASEGEEEQVVTTPTLAPTVTPGVVTDVVTEVTTLVGLDQTVFLGLSTDDWINLAISILIIIFGFTIGGRLVFFLLRLIVKRTSAKYDDKFLARIEPNIHWLVGVMSLQFATARLIFVEAAVKSLLNNLYFVFYILIISIILWKLIDFVADQYDEPETEDIKDIRLKVILPLAVRALRVVIIFMGVYLVLARFGVNVMAFTAALGIGGLALSLAAQDTLADAISGFIILLDQPFRIGDRIEIQDLGTWGDVVDIGTRTTRIRTRDNRMVIVPNSLISKGQIVNYTYPDPRYRIQEEIGIGYGMDVEEARQVIIDTVSQIEGVLLDKPVDALFVEFGDNAMTFRVRWWIESYFDTRRMFDSVNTALKATLESAGIDMPFTTYDVNLKLSPDDAELFSRVMHPGNKK
jgi:small-conductance mechanosensitive channel